MNNVSAYRIPLQGETLVQWVWWDARRRQFETVFQSAAMPPQPRLDSVAELQYPCCRRYLKRMRMREPYYPLRRMANVELARPETVEFSAVGGLFRTRSVTVADTHSNRPTDIAYQCLEKMQHRRKAETAENQQTEGCVPCTKMVRQRQRHTLAIPSSWWRRKRHINDFAL